MTSGTPSTRSCGITATRTTTGASTRPGSRAPIPTWAAATPSRVCRSSRWSGCSRKPRPPGSAWSRAIAATTATTRTWTTRSTTRGRGSACSTGGSRATSPRSADANRVAPDRASQRPGAHRARHRGLCPGQPGPGRPRRHHAVGRRHRRRVGPRPRPRASRPSSTRRTAPTRARCSRGCADRSCSGSSRTTSTSPRASAVVAAASAPADLGATGWAWRWLTGAATLIGNVATLQVGELWKTVKTLATSPWLFGPLLAGFAALVRARLRGRPPHERRLLRVLARAAAPSARRAEGRAQGAGGPAGVSVRCARPPGRVASAA